MQRVVHASVIQRDTVLLLSSTTVAPLTTVPPGPLVVAVSV